MVKEVVVHCNNALRYMIEDFSDDKLLTSSLEVQVQFIHERGSIKYFLERLFQYPCTLGFWKRSCDQPWFAEGRMKKCCPHSCNWIWKDWLFPFSSVNSICCFLYPEMMLPVPWMIESFHLYISTKESENLNKWQGPQSVGSWGAQAAPIFFSKILYFLGEK